ncbi:hypothetical protein BC830DRAFT_1171871 [Chytriomyces sp. MP71]|nr:hypothetical protein BC830DRAFT_1171871 [Chytriomyces sp. MP71]
MATLPQLPPEVLDLIPAHLDALSMMRLGHAVTYFKPITAAMYAFGRTKAWRFSKDSLWPQPTLSLREMSPAKHSLLKIVHRGGGSVLAWPRHFADLEDLVAFVPKNMPIEVALTAEQPLLGHIELLETLIEVDAPFGLLKWHVMEDEEGFPFVLTTTHIQAVARLWTRVRRIRSLHIYYTLPHALCEALPRIRGLQELAFRSKNATQFPPDHLLRMPFLRVISFEMAQILNDEWWPWLARLKECIKTRPGALVRVLFLCRRKVENLSAFTVDKWDFNERASVEDSAALKKKKGWEGIDDREAVVLLLQEFVTALVNANGGFDGVPVPNRVVDHFLHPTKFLRIPFGQHLAPLLSKFLFGPTCIATEYRTQP